MKNKHLCNSCKYTFSTCGAREVKFGIDENPEWRRKEADKIVECDAYILKEEYNFEHNKRKIYFNAGGEESMKVFLLEVADDKKCGGCSWETNSFYGCGQTLEDTKKNFEEDKEGIYGLGLCANCLIEIICREGVDIDDNGDMLQKKRKIKVFRRKKNG